MDTPGMPDLVIVDESLESTLDSVDQAEVRVTQAAESMGFPEEDTFRFGYAVREAMVNAVVHGNRYSANKQVRLLVIRQGPALEVRIADQGDGFHPDQQCDPLAEENLLNQSGRGLTLIRAFTDEFQVGPTEPRGTLARLVKRLPPAGSSDTSAPVGGEFPGGSL
ncbi:MAG: ATP-binding protein [Bryobacteraceae bacterium]|nr:ATP-binding protein [Solibacteraceae bacterium]MCL4840813.1 ATP-binding protein [Bryobacteraceae bacterium]